MHQSLRSRTMEEMRSSPHAGYHLTLEMASSASFLKPSTEQNHCSVTRKSTGCLQRQQWG